jgi:uncharacterized protein (TIGR03067 family)
MLPKILSLSFFVFLPAFVMGASPAAPDDKASLQGVWIAESMEADGKPAPAEALKRMRFTFKGDKLLVRGNFADDREEECSYGIDATKSPKHLDFTPPKEKEPILGIYEIKGDDLKLCLRHGGSSAGRPTEFSAKPDSELILFVFKRAKSE